MDKDQKGKQTETNTDTKPGVYSVSSGRSNKRNTKTITFELPTITKPNFNKPKIPQHIYNDKRYRIIAAVVLFLLINVLSGFSGALIENHHNSGINVFSSGQLSKQEKIVTSQSDLIEQIAKTVGPSVVSVNVNIDESSSSDGADDGFGLFGFSQPEEEEAAGTGIIIASSDNSAIVMTNRHVVPVGTTSVSITLANGTELKNVSVLGRTSQDSSLDLAFLKVTNTEGNKLTPAELGDSSQVQIGDSVVAIGNALGQFQNTVTSGIISGYGRTITASDSSGDDSSDENLDDLFQTDAAINEGNSGGPLVNMNGQVIGINVATAGDDAQNIGFSIPINDVKGLIKQVLSTGKFAQPYLGIRYIPLTSDVASEYNLKVDNGAYIAPSDDSSSPSIIPGSPAANAGLQVGDIITAVNGTNINQTNSLTSLLDQYDPGQSITLSVVRGSSTISVKVDLSTEPAND